jgi:hypothetical protein
MTRCTADTSAGMRCALADGHRHLHVTARGDRFIRRGGPLLFEGPWPLAGQDMTPESLRAMAQTPADSTADHIGPDHHTDALRYMATGSNRLAKAVTGELSHLGNRVVALEKQLAALGDPPVTRVELTTLTNRVDQLSGRHDKLTMSVGRRAEELDRLTDRVRQLQDQLERLSAEMVKSRSNHSQRLDALARADFGGGLAGMRRDINRIVSLIGAEGWNGRKELATTEQLAGHTLAMGKLDERLAVLEGRLCRRGNPYDAKLCVLPRGHKDRHADDQGVTWE